MARKKKKKTGRGRSRADKTKRRAKKKRPAAEPKRRDALRVVEPSKALPPVHVDRFGAVVPDPWDSLGLPAGTSDPSTIRDAWRELTVAAGVEQDPTRSAELREARDRLLQPKMAMERELGVLHLPDVEAWGLPEIVDDEHTLDARLRLLTQGLLYVLLEDELVG